MKEYGLFWLIFMPTFNSQLNRKVFYCSFTVHTLLLYVYQKGQNQSPVTAKTLVVKCLLVFHSVQDCGSFHTAVITHSYFSLELSISTNESQWAQNSDIHIEGCAGVSQSLKYLFATTVLFLSAYFFPQQRTSHFYDGAPRTLEIFFTVCHWATCSVKW
jgi:hypothetical protein